MARVNMDTRVPPSPDDRLDELADILARGMVRLAAKKTGCARENHLAFSAETRLSVTRAEGLETMLIGR